MATELFDDIKSFLDSLETTQADLDAFHAKKRTVLATARAQELMQLAESEQALTRQLQEHLRRRQQILQAVEKQGVRATSLSELIDHRVAQQCVPASSRAQLKSQIRRLQDVASRLRHQSWIHWIIARRASQYHAELLDLIAQGGRKQPFYSDTAVSPAGVGGAILDHSI